MSNEQSSSANNLHLRPIQNPKSKIQNLLIPLILILFTAFTLYNSVTLPLGEADDETDHYQYLRFVARTGHPPLTEAERHEAGFKGGLAPLYYWLTAWPIALVDADAPPDIRRVDTRPERHIPADGLGINHVLHTLDEQWPWQGQTLAWHLVRFLSLPMAWVTIIATYALVRRLVPTQKLVAVLAAAFVAFLPRFVISSAVINDDNLVFALIALLLLTQVIILQSDRPPTPKIMAAFGALFGLSLVAKYFSLILIPTIIFTLWIALHKPRTSLRPVIYGLPAFLTALFLTAGLWFIFIALRFNRIDELGLIPGLAASLGEPQITEGLVGLLSGQSIRPVAATYPLPQWFSLLYRSFWFEYGWMQVFAPAWVYALFTIFALAAAVGLIVSGVTCHVSRVTSPTSWVLTLHLTLFVVVLLARYVLSATIDTAQGRHLYPALPVIALFLAMGVTSLLYFIIDIQIKIRALSAVFTLAQRDKTPKHYLNIYNRLEISKWKNYLAAAAYLALIAVAFLLPALVSLQPAAFVLPRYQSLPVSEIPILLPVDRRRSIEFDSRLWLVGLEANTTVSAGDTLPVTLYWNAEQEAQQDYLISLCLQDDKARPVACWRGHFANGRYPARAWESGDTLVDTVFIPIPTCYRLTDQTYTLYLEIWSLDPASPTPSLLDPPLLQHTFAEPRITIQPTDSLKNLPQTTDLWLANQRLTGPTEMGLNQSLAQITYAANKPKRPPKPQMTTSSGAAWLPVTQLDTPLYLPCDEGPTPFAYLSHFIVDPTLKPDNYQPSAITNYQLLITNPRNRIFAPITTTLTFSNTLAPLSLQLPNHPTINFTRSPEESSQPSITNYQLQITNRQLPITIRWQAQRWLTGPLVISLKLLDKDFAVGGERVAALGGRYPNVLWVPTEIVEETYPLQIDPNAPPGLYVLEMSLIRQDETLPDGFEYLPLTNNGTALGKNLYPLTIRLLDPAHDTPPPQPFQAQLGQAIHLTGYDLTDQNNQPIQNSHSPGRTVPGKLKTQNLNLSLYWQSTDKISTNYTVFTQLVGPDGQVWAQWDNPPQAGRYPTTAWVENDTVIDRYSLSFREGAPSGDYRLLVGMYDPTTGERLPAAVNGQPQPDNAIELTTLSITP